MTRPTLNCFMHKIRYKPKRSQAKNVFQTPKIFNFHLIKKDNFCEILP